MSVVNDSLPSLVAMVSACLLSHSLVSLMTMVPMLDSNWFHPHARLMLVLIVFVILPSTVVESISPIHSQPHSHQQKHLTGMRCHTTHSSHKGEESQVGRGCA